MEDEWLTLVILAYDRAQIMDRTVRSLSARLPSGVRILISVNEKPAAVDEVWATAESLSDELGVQVVRTGSQLPMTEHFNWAWKHVVTPYFALLGDDDGISPEFIAAAEEIIRLHGPAVVQSREAYVILEDLGEFFPEGRVLFPLGTTGESQRVSATDLIREQSANFTCVSNMLHIIPLELIRRLEARCERWCWGFCPDITGGRLMMAELAVAPDIALWKLDSALSICGQSRHSNGASVIVGTKKGRNREFSREYGSAAQYPEWIKHRVSIEITTDLIKTDEMIRHYYPGVLPLGDSPEPSRYMPALLAEGIPPRRVPAQAVTQSTGWKSRPIVYLLALESVDRFGWRRTIPWSMAALVIWAKRTLLLSNTSLRARIKSTVPDPWKPWISRILHPVSRREVQWGSFRGMGNWDSPQWSSFYLESAVDVASMPWLQEDSRGVKDL